MVDCTVCGKVGEYPHPCAFEFGCSCWSGEPCAQPDPHRYGPDGVPIDGPLTTAAEYVVLALEHDDLGSFVAWGDQGEWSQYRNAAAEEGELYSLAIRGARAMRDLGLRYMVAFESERRYGCPERWVSR